MDRVNASGDPFAGVNHSIRNRVVTWFNKTVFSAPATGTYGTLGCNVFSGPGFGSFDRISAQLRVEMFNLFNRTNLANKSGSFGSGAFGTISGTAAGTSAPGIGQGEPRNVQPALKTVF